MITNRRSFLQLCAGMFGLGAVARALPARAQPVVGAMSIGGQSYVAEPVQFWEDVERERIERRDAHGRIVAVAYIERRRHRKQSR